MTKIIRMTAAAIREWRARPSATVDPEGRVVRNLTADEEKYVGALTKEAKRAAKTQARDVQLDGGAQRVEVTVRRAGPSNTEFVTEAFVTDASGVKLRVVSGREVLAAELLARHGECQLRYPNGTLCKHIRDPGKVRPTFKESLQLAPRPDNCTCRAWGAPHEGRHYPTCPYNKIAPPDEQALGAPTEEDLGRLPLAALGSLARKDVTVSRPDPAQATRAAEVLDSPEECRNGCLEWEVPTGKRLVAGQHHPMCVFYAKWKAKTSAERVFFLVDSETGEKVRQADADEVAAADSAFARTGIRSVQIDDVTYSLSAR